MRVLVLSQMFPCRRHPTSAIFFANLLRRLAPRVEKLIVVTPRPYIPKFLTRINRRWDRWYLDPYFSEEYGMEVLRPFFPSLRGQQHEGLNGMLMALGLRRLIKKVVSEERIDVMLGYNMLPEGVAVVRLARSLGLPVAFWAIGSDVNDHAEASRLNLILSRKCTKESDLVIAESRDLEKKISRLSDGQSNVRTYYKGIDIANFKNLPSREQAAESLHLDPVRRYLLFVGRVVHDKGIYELADAFTHIAREFTDVDLLIVGEELEKSALEDRFRREGIAQRVFFRGLVHHRDVALHMKVAHLLVFPTWAEGLPNVVLEAMAVGLPVVAADVGGIPEVLVNEITGLSVPARDAETLRQATGRMITDNALRDICTANALKLVSDNFDVRRNVMELYGMLEELTLPGRKRVFSGEAGARYSGRS